jgi:hypothetical protein
MMELANVKQFSRCAVGFARVKNDFGLWMDDPANAVSQLGYAQVFSRPDVDVLTLFPTFHKKCARISKIVNMKKFPLWLARAPNDNLCSSFHLCVVEFSNQGGQHVRAVQVEIVVRAIKVRRHRRDKVTAVLLAIRLAESDARYFC